MPSRSRMWQGVTRVRFAAPSSGASKAGAPARLEDAITLEPPLPRFRPQLFDKGKVKILERRNREERGVLVAHGLEDIDNRFLRGKEIRAGLFPHGPVGILQALEVVDS